jgi:hypothetical protein
MLQELCTFTTERTLLLLLLQALIISYALRFNGIEGCWPSHCVS